MEQLSLNKTVTDEINMMKAAKDNIKIDIINDSDCTADCDAAGVVSFYTSMKDLKSIMREYKLLVAMDISVIQKSAKELVQTDKQIGSSISNVIDK